HVRLPRGQEWKNPELASGTPPFPADRVVGALDDIRGELVKDNKPVSIFAHGSLAGLIAVRFAYKYPKSVRRLVLCSPQESARQTSKSVKDMEDAGRASGDNELVRAAQNMVYDSTLKRMLYEPVLKEEPQAL